MAIFVLLLVLCINARSWAPTAASKMGSQAGAHDQWPPYECEVKCGKAFINCEVNCARSYRELGCYRGCFGAELACRDECVDEMNS